MIELIENVFSIFKRYNTYEFVVGTNYGWDVTMRGMSSNININFRRVFPAKYPKYFLLTGFDIQHNRKVHKQWREISDGYYSVLIPTRGRTMKLQVYDFKGKLLFNKSIYLYTFKLLRGPK